MKKMFGLMMFALAVVAPAVYAANGLDDSVWQATFNDKTEDTLVFVDGKFVSTKCVPYGFGTSNYSSMKDGAQWQTQQTSGKDKTSWTGKMEGDKMSGTFTHTMPDGKKMTQDWTATKQSQ